MKSALFILSATLLMAACNPSPNRNITIEKRDSNMQVSSDSIHPQANALPTAAAKPKQTALAEKPVVKSSTAVRRSDEGESESMNTTSEREAKKKRGWSKTAKGAVVGGVVGAGTGAAVSKKNRGKGAVIGGVIGAGTGALIGHDMDKRDGRH